MKILIADDHRIVRECLKSTLQAAGLTVVGVAANGHEAIALAKNLRPNLVLMDLAMPELNGVDATRRIIKEMPGIAVLALSTKTDRWSVLSMFAAGAVGYLSKSSTSLTELLEAITAVASGRKYVSYGVAAAVQDSVELTRSGKQPSIRGASKALSGREREVLQLIAEGNSSKQIAARLNLAVPTIETHRRQVMNKLGLRSVAELTKYAVREGLSPLD